MLPNKKRLKFPKRSKRLPLGKIGVLFLVVILAAICGLIFQKIVNFQVFASNQTLVPPTLFYTALGDSITAGAQAPVGQGFVDQYANDLNNDLGVTTIVSNLGIAGATAGNLAGRLSSDTAFKNSITKANVITIGVGINDIEFFRMIYRANGQNCGGPDNQDCLRNYLNSFKTSWDSMLSQIYQLNTGPNMIIRVNNTYYGSINTDVSNGDFALLNPYLIQMNSYVDSKASTYHYIVNNVHDIFNGASGQNDPIATGFATWTGHPNLNGHTIIANGLRALGYGSLNNIVTCLNSLPDVNGDHIVNSIDLQQDAMHFGDSSSQNYDPKYDVDHNGSINSIDLFIIARNFGKACR